MEAGGSAWYSSATAMGAKFTAIFYIHSLGWSEGKSVNPLREGFAAGLGGWGIEVQCPPPSIPSSFSFVRFHESYWLGLGELNPGSSFLATVFVYVSTRRCLTTDFLLIPGNREKRKPQQLSLLKTQNWLLCLITPDGRALFLGGNAEVSSPRSLWWAVRLPQAEMWCPGGRQPLAQGSGAQGRGHVTDQCGLAWRTCLQSWALHPALQSY